MHCEHCYKEITQEEHEDNGLCDNCGYKLLK